MKTKIYILLLVMHTLTTVTVFAQTDRQLIREGNRAYAKGEWVKAETQYRKALAQNKENPQASYNLACALMAQQKDSMALQQYVTAAQLEQNPMRKAMSYHNIGTIWQNHRQYAQAIDAYKMALRNNPKDNETRYNLALCQKLLKNQPQQDKNKDKNKKEQDKKQNKQDQDKNQDKDKNKDQRQKPDQDKMSRENAEQMLNAAVQSEKATKRKIQKALSQPRKKSLEKNW